MVRWHPTGAISFSAPNKEVVQKCLLNEVPCVKAMNQGYEAGRLCLQETPISPQGPHPTPALRGHSMWAPALGLRLISTSLNSGFSY